MALQPVLPEASQRVSRSASQPFDNDKPRDSGDERNLRLAIEDVAETSSNPLTCWLANLLTRSVISNSNPI